jgi:hypothetical protein
MRSMLLHIAVAAFKLGLLALRFSDIPQCLQTRSISIMAAVPELEASFILLLREDPEYTLSDTDTNVITALESYGGN